MAGGKGGTEIDVRSVRREGAVFDASADRLGMAADKVTGFVCGEAGFGRHYRAEARGYAAVRGKLETALRRWAEGSRAVADGLTGSAAAVRGSDISGASSVSGSGSGAGASGGR